MGVLIKNKINYSGSGMDSYESPNLDYDSAVTLTLPDYTGYSYTMPADGVIMTRSYGSVGSTVIITNSVEYGLSYRNDTWSVVFIPFEKGTVMTIRRGSSSSGYPSDSWIKFIPYKVKFGGCTPLHEYSSNEHVVGTWIDGSPIYEKTYTITNISSNYTVVDLELVTSTINLIWIHEGFAVNGVYSTGNVVPYAGSSAAGELGMCGYINKNNNTVEYHYRSGSYLSGGTAYITFRYVKV